MRKNLISAALAASFLAGAAGVAQAEESPISANVTFTSEYVYRGYAQSNENFAVQGGFDYAHDSGFYVGVWGSSIDWLDTGGAEVDLYAGFGNTIGDTDFSYDVGVLQYFYPGGKIGGEDPDTTEAYIGIGWKFLSFTYSYAFTDLFGIEDSDGSEYYDLSADFELGAGFGLGAHFGRQKIEGGGSYNDWKLGVTKDFIGLTWGLDYIDTDLDDDDNGDERVVFHVTKSF